MKILFCANLIPYPQDGGGKIFTYSVLKSLCVNNEVDLLCFYEKENIQEGIMQMKNICRNVKAFPIRITTNENKGYIMKKAFLSLFSRYSLGTYKYIDTKFQEELEKTLLETQYDCVFFNILQMYIYRDKIKKIAPNVKIVLYEQNCETLIYRRYKNEAKNILKKIFLSIECKKLEIFERGALNTADSVILLSQEDKNTLEKITNRPISCEIIPIGVEDKCSIKKYDLTKKEKITMLFVGTLTWAANSEGLIWFLENVMPKFKNPDKYELYIIGKNPNPKIQELSKKYENVMLKGYVESLDEYYEKSDVLVVPLFVGSGQRVKIIEAFARGMAVVSTPVGAEGLNYCDGENILIANSQEEFKTKIDRCFDREYVARVGEKGRELYVKEYSIEVIEKKINSVIG